ncbi:MAG: hypothetical protein ACLUI3_14905 [Christensenellales bacterium]
MIVGADGVCLCALRGWRRRGLRYGLGRSAHGRRGERRLFRRGGARGRRSPRGRGYLLAEISGDSLSELLSRGLNPPTA